MSVAQRMVIVLGATAIGVAIILALVNGWAQPQIKVNKEKEIREAVLEVLPQAKKYEVVGDGIFQGFDNEGNKAGVAFLAVGNGWGSTLTMIVGTHPSKKEITGLVVLDQRETPGLGDLIVGEEFRAMFKKLAYEPEVTFVKNKDPEKPNEIRALTGATITSRAVTEIINERLDEVAGRVELGGGG